MRLPYHLFFPGSDRAGNHSLAADASWLVFAKTLAFGVTFVLPLILVRQLSQEDFGLYKQLFLLVGTAITMLPFGFAMSAFYFLPRAGDRGGTVALNIFLVHAAVAVVAAGVLVYRPSTLGAIFDDPGLVVYARPVAAVLFLAVASTFVDLLALANGDVRRAGMFLVATNLTKTVLLSVAAIGFASVRAILLASVIHGLLQLVFLCVYMKSAFGSLLREVDLGLLRKQLAYAVPLGLAGWLYWLQMEAHHYFVARAFGSATYAIYAIGCVSLPLASLFGESIGSVVIHRISQLHSQNRRSDILGVVSQAIRHLAAFYFPLYVLLMVTGRELIEVIFTPRFAASWPIFAINLTLMPLAILAVVSDAVIRSYSECRTFLLGLRIVLVPLLLAGLWFVTPRYGPVAAISVMVGTNVVERLIVASRTAKALEISWRDAALRRGVAGISMSVLVAAAATVIARAALHNMKPAGSLAVSVGVFIMVYLIVSRFQPRADAGVSVDWQVGGVPEAKQQPVAGLLARACTDAPRSDPSGAQAT